MQLTNAIFHIHAWQHRIVQKCVLELHSVVKSQLANAQAMADNPPQKDNC